jgi:hypothetical protein
MSGYARAWRDRWDHPVFKSKQEAAVWAWICDTARFRRHSFQTRFGMVTLERGQLLISQRIIADDFGLGRQVVRRLMEDLKLAGMVIENSTHSASRAGTIITIVNYDKYQGDNADIEGGATQGQPNVQPITNPRPTQDQPTREEREKREEKEEGYRPLDSPIGEPPGRRELALVQPIPQLFDANEIDPAFEAYQALRLELKPSARPIELTAPRRAKLTARLRDLRSRGGWAAVLANIRGSPFLRGETSRGRRFVPEIDWLLKPENLQKVLEGFYDENLGSAGRIGGSRVPTSPVDALSIAIAASGLGG